MGSLALFSFVTVICVLSMVESQGEPELIILMTERHSENANGVIYKLAAHHNNFTILPLSNVLTPTAIDYDNVNKHMYWTDISVEQIRRADLDGGNDVIVASLNSISNPEGIAVDGAVGKLFYTDRGNKVIVRIEMIGFSSTTIVNTGLTNPWGITADTKNKKLYWADHELDRIESSDYNGNGRRIVTSSVFAVTGVAINENTGRLYWCEYNGNISSIRTDGTQKTTLFHETTPVRRFLDISLFNGFLYATEKTRREIIIVPEDGGNYMFLTSATFENINGIHVFSPNSVETGCPDGRYGVGCTAVCGRCGLTTPCEKTIGVCLGGCEAGYQGTMCTEVCTAGTYGGNCSSVCGHCRTERTCHHLTGQCPIGCQSGWKGERCKECRSGKYGFLCSRDCGYCAGGSTCDSDDGRCPSGCQTGWKGSKCQERDGTKGGATGDATTTGKAFIGYLPLAAAVLVIAATNMYIN